MDTKRSDFPTSNTPITLNVLVCPSTKKKSGPVKRKGSRCNVKCKKKTHVVREVWKFKFKFPRETSTTRGNGCRYRVLYSYLVLQATITKLSSKANSYAVGFAVS